MKFYLKQKKDNNEWVSGYYVRLYNTQNKKISHRIYTGYSEYCCDELFEEFYEVIPETIIGKENPSIRIGQVIKNSFKK